MSEEELNGDEHRRIHEELMRSWSEDGTGRLREYALAAVSAEYRWWSQIKPRFIFDHLRAPWTFPFEDFTCPVPVSCETHYDYVQLRIWRIGGILKLYPLISDSVRRREFPAFDFHYGKFLDAWTQSANQDPERRLPDEHLERWIDTFGDSSMEPR